MKKINLLSGVILLILALIGGNSFAGSRQDQARKGVGGSDIVSVNRVLSLIMQNGTGEQIGYEITDSVKSGVQGDGIIDFANIIKQIERPGSSMQSKFPVGTSFPIRVKIAYFRPGNELSNSAIYTLDKWLSGFQGRIVQCVDAQNRLVPAPSGGWSLYIAKPKLMKQLQALYDKHY